MGKWKLVSIESTSSLMGGCIHQYWYTYRKVNKPSKKKKRALAKKQKLEKDRKMHQLIQDKQSPAYVELRANLAKVEKIIKDYEN